MQVTLEGNAAVDTDIGNVREVFLIAALLSRQNA